MPIPLPPASPWQLVTNRAPGRTTGCAGIMLARMLTTHPSTGPTRSVCALSTKMISPSMQVSRAILPGSLWQRRRPSMTTANSSPFPRERKLILGLLLILAAASWALLIWQSAAMNSQAMGMGLTMGMSAVLFIVIWVVMMIAMMFPTAAPMILMFTRVYASKGRQNQVFVPTWVFVSAYLLVWTLFGLVAYPLAVGAERLAGQSMWLMNNAPRMSGALLVVAGLYQLSPLKHICLSKCRTPLQFILGSWRDGYGGAFRMGFLHGAY